jgi:iron(III) transport system substrate-binding protein
MPNTDRSGGTTPPDDRVVGPRRNMRARWTALGALVAVVALLAGACGDGDQEGGGSGSSESLVLYSGRDEALVGPIIEAFEEETGIDVEVRYGNSAELGAALLEEGGATPADVFYSQEVGSVGVLAKADLLSPLPEELVERVDERFRPAQGTDWVGVTGRSRVIVYNPELVDEVPASVVELTDPAYEGQVAWAPSNAGFQAFVTAFRVTRGEDDAKAWIEAMKDNGAQTYSNNVEVLEAVNEGRIGIGLINHYYWARMVPEVGGEENMTAQLVFPSGDDPGALVNATAAALTTNGSDNPAALRFIEFLLSQSGQREFVERTWEYPLVREVDDPEGLPALEELGGPQLDLTDLDSLEQTQQLLADTGLLD